jgi:glycosyltransferase involved in cell wall biosynthesis
VRLLYQGALRPGSGLRDLLPALAFAPRYELDVYGDGEEAAVLRKSAAALGLSGRVRFHGAVPFEALERPHAECHIGVHLLSPTCLNFDLALSNKLFDCFHALAPLLLGDTAAHREFLAREPIGLIPAGRSPEAILAALEALCAGYGGFVSACLAARERWHWEAFAGCLDRALAAGPARGDDAVS